MMQRGEELFDLLDRLLRDNAHIDELAFVPDCDELRFDDEKPAPIQRLSLNGETKTAILLRGDKVALAFWALPPIYKHASSLLNALRRKARRYPSLWSEAGHARDVSRFSRAVLIVSADNYSAWNARKHVIQAGRHKSSDEFAFIDMLLTKHPKSGETWAHRGWLYRKLGLNDKHTFPILERERNACTRFAESYARNYYAWTHRLALLHSLSVLSLSADELSAIFRWSRKHISDASALHYRAQLMLSLGAEEWTRLVENETSQLAELIEFYEGHEALFNYLRFLLWLCPCSALFALMKRLCVSQGKQRKLALNVVGWLVLFKAPLVPSLGLDPITLQEVQEAAIRRTKADNSPLLTRSPDPR